MPSPHETIAAWSAAQLAPWRQSRLSVRAVTAALDALNAEIDHIFLFDFADGAVRVRPKPHYDEAEMAGGAGALVWRARQYRAFFELVAQRSGLHGRFTLGMTMEDYLHRRFDVPVFGFQKRAGSNQILVPDIDAVRSGFYADVPDDPVAYADKRIMAVFVGSTTGEYHSVESVAARTCQRLRAGLFFRDVDEVEFRLPQIAQCLSAEAEQAIRALGFGEGRMEWREHLDYRFLLSMDGNGATCSRVAMALKSNSVLVKYESPFSLYYFPGLIAGRHFLSVGADQEVVDLVRREQDSPGLFHPVAREGRAFFDAFLTLQPSIAYTAQILSGYSDRFGSAGAQGKASTAADATGLMAIAHLSNHGDLTAHSASWVGMFGHLIEGFSLAPLDDPAGPAFEYRLAHPEETDEVWSQAGEFVGSRGGSTPVFGFAARIAGDAAEMFGCCYGGMFRGGEYVGPVWDGLPCVSATGAPLEAIRVTIRRR